MHNIDSQYGLGRVPTPVTGIHPPKPADSEISSQLQEFEAVLDELHIEADKLFSAIMPVVYQEPTPAPPVGRAACEAKPMCPLAEHLLNLRLKTQEVVSQMRWQRNHIQL